MICKYKLISGFFAATCLTSCATIVHGSNQSIGISSNPTDALVWVDNNFVGQTPMIVQMSRKSGHFVRIELEGYRPCELAFTQEVSGWIFGNIVFGGVIGVVVDALTGSIYKLTPSQIQAQLCANNIVHSQKSQDSYIAIVLQPDPAWQKIGQLEAAN